MPRIGVDRQVRGISNIKIDGIEGEYVFENVAVPVAEQDEEEENNLEEEENNLEEGEEGEEVKEEHSEKEEATSDSSSSGEDDKVSPDLTEEVPKEEVPKPKKVKMHNKTLVNLFEEELDDDDNEIDYDTHEFKHQLSDHDFDPVDASILAPEKFSFDDLPQDLTALKVLKRKVYWKVEVLGNGKPGWLISEVVSGPPDPISSAEGVTMMLKSTTRMDSNTPVYLQKNPVKVYFNAVNHKKTWFLLKELK